jgi:hypothetical protein
MLKKTSEIVRHCVVMVCLISLMGSGMNLCAQWARVIGFKDGQYYPHVFLQTKDGGYVMAGVFYSRFGFGWLWKLSASCDLEWSLTIGTDNDIAIVSEGGFITAGYGGLTMLDENGEWEWNLRFSGEFLAVEETADHGFITIGKNFNYESRLYESFLLKLTNSREVEWVKQPRDEACSFSKLITTEDGGHLILAHTSEFGSGDQDACLIRLSPESIIQWQKLYGGEDADELSCIAPVDDGSFVAAGWTRSAGNGDKVIWVMKILPDGEVEWQKTYSSGHEQTGTFIHQTSDGGFLLSGSVGLPGNEWMLILKLSVDGKIEWERIFGDGEGRQYSGENGFMSLEDRNGSFLVVGGTDSLAVTSRNWYWSPYWILLLRMSAQGELPGCRYLKTLHIVASDLHFLPQPSFFTLEKRTYTFRSVKGENYLSPPAISEICPQGKGAKVRR